MLYNTTKRFTYEEMSGTIDLAERNTARQQRTTKGGDVMQQVRAKEDFPIIRIKHGYSINELARRMGVNPSVVYSIEKGNGVRPKTAKKAVEALGEPFESLFIIEDTTSAIL